MGAETVNNETRELNPAVLENPLTGGFPPRDAMIPLIPWEKTQGVKAIPPTKPRNIDRRPREYLIHDEVNAMIQGAQRVGRHPYRDALTIHMAYRHALRASELVGLKWSQVDFSTPALHVVRSKSGVSGLHPLQRCTVEGLRELRRRYPNSPCLFVSERGERITRWRFGVIVARAGRLAGLSMPVHPHMLRHAAGGKLANDGRTTRDIQEYLGHKCIGNSVRYMRLAPGRFECFWTD